jgi:hypothetical protein
MCIYKLKIKLLSDTTFGRGDGVAGLIDTEVEHDQYGFPYLRGRTLKGLLSEECDNLIAVLSPDSIRQHWQKVACKLLGKPGSTLETESQMNVGDACLPLKLRQAVADQMKQRDNKLTRVDILESLTTIRRQTAIDPTTGTADEKSLRSSRVILRELEFTADLSFAEKPSDETQTLLSVGTLALRRIGSGRNRGRGSVQCRLFDPENHEIKDEYLQRFGTGLEVTQ